MPTRSLSASVLFPGAAQRSSTFSPPKTPSKATGTIEASSPNCTTPFRFKSSQKYRASAPRNSAYSFAGSWKARKLGSAAPRAAPVRGEDDGPLLAKTAGNCSLVEISEKPSCKSFATIFSSPEGWRTSGGRDTRGFSCWGGAPGAVLTPRADEVFMEDVGVDASTGGLQLVGDDADVVGAGGGNGKRPSSVSAPSMLHRSRNTQGSGVSHARQRLSKTSSPKFSR